MGLAHSSEKGWTLEFQGAGMAGLNCVTRACWRAPESDSARKSLNPRARRSEGIVGLRAPHVRPNLGSGDDWSERVTDGD
ncbi:jg10945 [Pararge aegeria aegeria]|uniref:Jg10945 protein n=1 Tax=Pararge aegeria aegeria TaxID=348720 RepID=A0A8S4SB87_9NEOP|nr:jg10945 [Pararge aegeria aegeria]